MVGYDVQLEIDLRCHFINSLLLVADTSMFSSLA